MKSQSKKVLAVSAVAVMTAFQPVLACDDGHEEKLSRLASVCETMTKARLKAPATYRRAKVSDFSFLMTAAEYKDKELTRMRDSNLDGDAWRDAYQKLDSVLAAIAESPTAAPTVLESRIAYDAENSFGALLRGYSTCQFISPDGNKDNINELAVTIEMSRS